MTTNTLSSYLLALILILSAIFTVSWGVQRCLIRLTEAHRTQVKQFKPSL